MMPIVTASTSMSPSIKRLLQAESKSSIDAAWAMGDAAYEHGDPIEAGVEKAAQQQIRPGTNEYAAFLTAFARRVRRQEAALHKADTATPVRARQNNILQLVQISTTLS